MNPKIDAFIDKAKQWKEELRESRRIVLDCGLTEELKWYQPCYCYNGTNVLILSCFKEYFALAFFKGVLLKDDAGILVQPTENMQAVRQLRFKSVEEILEKESAIRTYIQNAIEVEKAGLKVELKSTKEFDMPEELVERLETDSAFKEAFEALTPGRQRGYILYFSGAKQSKTREDRIEKAFARILEGKGWNER